MTLDLTGNIRLVLGILTVARLAQLIVLDDGPFDVFKKMRLYFVLAHTHRRKTVGKDWKYHILHLFNGVTHCPYCCGVWLAAFVLILVCIPTFGGDLFLLWMSLSYGACWLERTTNHF